MVSDEDIEDFGDGPPRSGMKTFIMIESLRSTIPKTYLHISRTYHQSINDRFCSVPWQ